MSRFFSAVRRFFANIFSPAGQQKITIALGQAEALVQEVLPVVELISSLTPNKTDDEIVAVVKKYAVPVTVPVGPMTDADKGSLLLQTAVTAATQDVAAAVGLPSSVITLAVQTAYTVLRSATR